jgi:peptidoglycan/LPS O-acetylase OafA/YrhL
MRLIRLISRLIRASRMSTSSSRITTKQSKIDYLDGLRGFAAVSVAIHHFYLAFWDCTGTKPPFPVLLYKGTLQVLIFFVLSGRVLMDSYLKKPSFEKLYSLIIRRVFRLFLPLLGYMIIWHFLRAIDYVELVKYRERVSGMCISQEWHYIEIYRPLDLQKDFWDLVKMFMGKLDMLLVPAGVFWTIVVELYGSYFVYITGFVYTAIKEPILKVFFALSMCYLGLYYDHKFVPFTLGFLMCAADKVEYVRMLLNNKIVEYPLTALILRQIVYTANNWQLVHDNFILFFGDWDLPYCSYSDLWVAFLILILLHVSSLAQIIFSLGFFKWLGNVSFGLYLAHGLALPLGAVGIAHYLSLGYSIEASLLRSLTCVYLPAGLLGGALFNNFIDRPSVQLVQYIFNNGLSGTFTKILSAQEFLNIPIFANYIPEITRFLLSFKHTIQKYRGRTANSMEKGE